ncbi:MAG TPA: sulfurtransferase [Cytophagales bacterium]|nr:sulfurtransferase [Cytophagales bacterium]
MINTLKKMLGFGPETNYKELVQNGATIIDVRTLGEYQSGHIKGSSNIPLDTLGAQLQKWDKNKPIITCCASGMRSASAKNLLLSKGFKQVYNGGGWASLQRKLK